MSEIKGKKRDPQEGFGKKVGLFSGKVIAVNPTMEEYKDILGIELKPDSNATEYIGKSKDGNTTVRVNFWLEETKSKQKYPVTFFLEDKEKVNKDSTKKQYINSVGSCSWADDPNNLPEWFKKRDFRVAYVGEEELYNFMRTWLGALDFKDAETTLSIEWKHLMKNNLKDIRSQINGEYCTPIVSLATVKTVTKEDGDKEYQGVFNKAFLPEYALKQFRVVDYSKQEVLDHLKKKKSSELKPHERFVLTVTGEYGCKDFYVLKDLKDYDPAENIVASNAPISDDSPDY